MGKRAASGSFEQQSCTKKPASKLANDLKMNGKSQLLSRYSGILAISRLKPP
jgi:hypothetical protein